LCMPGWSFCITPCCPFRPILLYKFREDLCMFSNCLLFWHCPFNLCIYWSFYWRIYHYFLFIFVLPLLLLVNVYIYVEMYK
jgi:hypothetical protein